jgi:hypothetical protein
MGRHLVAADCRACGPGPAERGAKVTLDEWTEQVKAELAQAGFSVSEHEGFPIVKMPESHFDRVRLLKFRTAMPSDRTVYAEGMLFVPARQGRPAALSAVPGPREANG